MIMKKRLIMITLVFLITLPTLCSAANISLKPSLFNYAFARTMSENYVLDLKELYAEDQKNEKYLDARLKYQIASSKFIALKSVIELSIINGKIPNLDDQRYKEIEIESINAYNDFESVAQDALNVNTEADFSKKKLSLSTVDSALTTINSILTTWNKYQEKKEVRLTKLNAWFTKYYEWPDWNAIKQPSKAATQITTPTTTPKE